MKRRTSIIGGVVAIAGSFVIFVVPFLFIILMAFKDQPQSGLRDFSWPRVSTSGTIWCRW